MSYQPTSGYFTIVLHSLVRESLIFNYRPDDPPQSSRHGRRDGRMTSDDVRNVLRYSSAALRSNNIFIGRNLITYGAQ